jgi:hypothetical protein
MGIGDNAWHDELDTLADEGGTVVHLAVWAARAADANGDPVAAEEWRLKAAHEVGRLF